MAVLVSTQNRLPAYSAHHQRSSAFRAGNADMHRQWMARSIMVGLMLCLTSCGLPDPGVRSYSTAFKKGAGTPLGVMTAPLVKAHRGQSGICPLSDAPDAFAARLILADAAQRSLDVQYYIWNKDKAGKVLTERLLRAADRGVRVRLLLDDIGTKSADDVLLAIDSHPNIEVRMFNPVKMRSFRMVGMFTDFARLNKRMHNKSFIADGQVAIVGGRNVGDEYYGAKAGSNFADLDVAVIGPVVNEVSDAFDLYWNYAAAIPIANLSHRHVTAEEYVAKRKALVQGSARAEQSEYAETLRHSKFAAELRQHAVPFRWGPARIVRDPPDKVLSSASQQRSNVTPALRESIEQADREVFMVSPYFVPRDKGVALLAEAHRRGVRVVVVTNSMASADGAPVFSGYARYRKAVVEAGVELYEIKATPDTPRAANGSGSFVRMSGGHHSSEASLHAKTFFFDRTLGYVGSYNLDPRSSRLNTEMGVIFKSPELSRQMSGKIDHDLGQTAYAVRLQGHRLVWVTSENGRTVTYHADPEAGLGRRIQVFILRFLPIEGLL